MNTESNKVPKFFGIHARPGPVLSKLLAILPIVAIIAVYSFVSHARHKENPQDKLTPTAIQMYEGMKDIMTVPDKRTGKILFWQDTKASLTRLALGVSISAAGGYVLGILIGLFPGFRRLLLPVLTVLSNINPLAILVIVLVALGIGETSKIFLIVFGVGIPIARSVGQLVEAIPGETIVKQFSLGASQFEIVMRLVVPQMIPRLIDLVRVSLGTVWIFVIAAEAVASTEGLGYRIYLQQRYMNMAVIIPYVLYITLLAYTSDFVLRMILKLRKFQWYQPEEES